MKPKHFLTTAAFGVGALGGAMLVYGALVESKNLQVEEFDIPIKGLPEDLSGLRIAVLGDFHLSHEPSIELAQRAVAAALDADPDVVVLVGDLIARWRALTPWMLGAVLEPLLMMDGAVIAVPGNHEYHGGTADLLAPILEEFDIKLLRNESISLKGIEWVGIDSFNEEKADLPKALGQRGSSPANGEPRIVLWHESDAVDLLPEGAASLQISGHSHGGQFRFPGGLIPMKSRNGEKYIEGFYPHATTPLFVTRGIGTTGLPTRFLCPPQVAILTLEPAEIASLAPVVDLVLEAGRSDALESESPVTTFGGTTSSGTASNVTTSLGSSFVDPAVFHSDARDPDLGDSDPLDSEAGEAAPVTSESTPS